MGHLHRFTDPTGRLDIHQVVIRQQNGAFHLSPARTVRQDFGYSTTEAHWLFFELAGSENSADGNRLMLEIEYANLDDLTLYEVSNDTIRLLGRTGDHFRFRERPYLNNNYAFPIRLRAGQTSQYFLRVNQSYATLSFFVRLWPRQAFLASDRNEYFLWGIFIGIVCLILVLNFVMLLAVRDWIYLWYNLYLHFITMHLFCDAGLGFQYLWPDSPHLNDFMPVYLYVWAAMVAQTTFMQYFINQDRSHSRVYRWVNAFKWFVVGCLAVAIAMPLFDVAGHKQYMYQFVSLATSYFVPVIVVLTALSLYEKVTRGEGEKMVRYYGYALAVQFTGYGLVAVMNFCQAQGWPLPFDVETYVVLGGTLLTDLVFFTYGLAYRYMHTLHGNQQLELGLLQSQQEAQQQVIHSLQDERRRLAQDLHDDVGPLLATAKGYLSRFDRVSRISGLQRAQTLLDEAADELRALSHQLLPRQLAQSGLASALAEACHQASRRGAPVQFVSLGQGRTLGEQRDQMLFSMAVQLIRIAQQQTMVTEITAQLLFHEDEVSLSVEDNGQSSAFTDSDLINLRAKADLVGATLLLDNFEAGNSALVSLPNPTLV
ncbi:sensor histidine kinase [Rhabdobacter roseus]|uniref:sensor histidine kinase n=1 Tax=Rhabdobacter roseus TaxID=1655419 RepID=UPI001C840F6C